MDTYASEMIEEGVFLIGKSPGLYTLQDVFTLNPDSFCFVSRNLKGSKSGRIQNLFNPTSVPLGMCPALRSPHP